MAGEIELKVGEGRWISFTLTRGGANLSAATIAAADFRFGVKQDEDDTTFLLLKDSGEFDKTYSGESKIRVNVSSADTLTVDVGTYVAELESILISGEDVDLSPTIPFILRESVIKPE
jgi:hypothetical protein